MNPANEPKPLLSDQRLREIELGKFASETPFEMNYSQGMQDARYLYEADRAKTRALLSRALEILRLGDSFDRGYKVHELISEIEEQLKP